MSDNGVSIRKRMLHVLLWCLAASAASGVLTVLVSDRDIMWRVTVMGFVSAIAVGLMIPLSMLVDRERFRAAGLAGMLACVAAFLLSTGLIWAGWGGWRLEEHFALTLVLLIFMAPVVVALLCIRATESGRLAGLVGLACAGVASLLFLIEIWRVDIFGSRWLFGETAASLCWFGTIATLALIGLRPGDRPWRWMGVVLAAVGFLMSQLSIWLLPGRSWNSLVSVLTVAALIAFANVIHRARVGNGQRLVVYGTIAAAGAVVLFINLDVHVQEWDYQDPFGFKRFTAGASIVTVSGTLAVMVLSLLNRRAARRAAVTARTADGAPGAPLTAITLKCPRCTKEQTLPIGDGVCSGCRLIIHTRVETPVCTTCGYDLAMIKGDQCPECGSRIQQN